MIIDAHQHFWQFSKPFNYEWLKKPVHKAICRDYLPPDLKIHMDAVAVRRSVFVQTQHHLEETRWVLGLADEFPFIAGVVGWVDLKSEACEEQVLELKQHSKFVGVRHIVQDEPDDDWIMHPDVLRGLKVLENHQVPYDLLFFVKHLKHAATLGRLFPGLRLVIDHLAKPCIREQRLDDWVQHLRAAARLPNLYCKLSGMITEASWQAWKPADLKPYVQTALDAFGAERCMFGSDWPVCELAGTYEQAYHALVEALGPISTHERSAIFANTAIRFYGLKL